MDVNRHIQRQDAIFSRWMANPNDDMLALE